MDSTMWTYVIHYSFKIAWPLGLSPKQEYTHSVLRVESWKRHGKPNETIACDCCDFSRSLVWKKLQKVGIELFNKNQEWNKKT